MTSSGDNADLAALAEDYRERIRRYIATMVGDPALVEDLTQETFHRAFGQLHQLRDPERVGPWIYKIAVNLCRVHLRERVRQDHPANSRSLETDPAGARRSILSNYVERESAEALALAIDHLPILLREAFVLHLVENLPYVQIAEITGASVDALHVRTHRAKALLRRQLGSVVDTFWSEMRG